MYANYGGYEQVLQCGILSQKSASGESRAENKMVRASERFLIEFC